jgi:hypothetical protein
MGLVLQKRYLSHGDIQEELAVILLPARIAILGLSVPLEV